MTHAREGAAPTAAVTPGRSLPCTKGARTRRTAAQRYAHASLPAPRRRMAEFTPLGDRPVRVVLVGCGRHASLMLHSAIRFNPRFQVVGVCDLDERRAGDTAYHFGNAPSGAHAPTLLAQVQADAAVVCLPPDALAAGARECMQAGVDVFMEKPVATTLADAHAVVADMDATGRRCMVAFCRRFNPTFQRLHQIVHDPAFGPVHLFYGVMSSGFRPRATDLVRVAAVHDFDIARYLVGELEEVSAYQSATERDGRHGIAVAVSGRFAGGAVCVLHLDSTTVWFAEGSNIKVVGERNWAGVDNTHRLYWQGPPEHIHTAEGHQEAYEEPSPARIMNYTYSAVSNLEK